jgi:hypothetical protein
MWQSLFEEMAFGFQISGEDETVDQSNRYDLYMRRFQEAAHVCSSPADSLNELTIVAATMLNSEAALELTSGVDSSLVLSLALAGGARGFTSFTIDLGAGSEADTDGAAEIARRAAIPHRIVRPNVEAPQILEDAFSFASRSGFKCNCVAYGWLPSVFRQLDSSRNAQVGGVGGEIASGFYRSPLDQFCRLPRFLSVWRRLRLERPGRTAFALFHPKFAQKAIRFSQENLRRFFSNYSSVTEWQQATDQFYCEKRISKWAIPALRASSGWYEPRMPLLSTAYKEWAFAVNPQSRSRSRQIILRNSALLMAHKSQLFEAIGRRQRNRAANKLSRTMQRIVGLKRTNVAYLSTFASLLCQNRAFVFGLKKLADNNIADTGLRREAVQYLLEKPEMFPYEVGFLGTRAMALGMIPDLPNVDHRCA